MLPAGPKYVIDACAIIDLDGGLGQPTALTTDDATREYVWGEVIILIEAGRLVTVFEVMKEVKRYAPDAWERLKGYKKFVSRRTPSRLILAGQIIEDYPDLVDDLDARTHTKEPGDPYVIAYAELNQGVVVVTNEKAKHERSKNNKKGTHIPDVCLEKGIPCKKLDELVTEEGMWPEPNP